MASCVFFGHRDMNVQPYAKRLESEVEELIERRGVNVFYCGFRGDFDVYCASLVWRLKRTYPSIKSIMALSYMPDKNFVLPRVFDESLYIPERSVPPKFAIFYTNRRLCELADYIVAGVIVPFGRAYSACKYAIKLNKKPVNVTGAALW